MLYGTAQIPPAVETEIALAQESTPPEKVSPLGGKKRDKPRARILHTDTKIRLKRSSRRFIASGTVA